MEKIRPFFAPEAQMSPEEFETLFSELKKTSFYAHTLIDSFKEEVDPNSVVTECHSHKSPRYLICGRIKNKETLYLTLELEENEYLRLMLSRWEPARLIKARILKESEKTPPTKEELRESILEEYAHQNIITVSSSDRRLGGIETLPDHKVLIKSALAVEFFPSRWQIAPAHPETSPVWWILREFVPRLLERVEPFARVPYQEMEHWTEGKK